MTGVIMRRTESNFIKANITPLTAAIPIDATAHIGIPKRVESLDGELLRLRMGRLDTFRTERARFAILRVADFIFCVIFPPISSFLYILYHKDKARATKDLERTETIIFRS